MGLIRLNVGPGEIRIPGEIGVDLYDTPARDVTADLRALPFPDGAAEQVRLSHVLEHIPYREAATVILEQVRVLAPGGRLLVTTPDMAATCQAYVNAGRLDTDGEQASKALVLRNIYGSQTAEGQYHMSGWDESTLAALVGACGLVGVTTRRQREPDGAFSVTVEAVKA